MREYLGNHYCLGDAGKKKAREAYQRQRRTDSKSDTTTASEMPGRRRPERPTKGRGGPIARMMAKHGIVLNFTCMKKRDGEQPNEANCSPEDQVRQVKMAGVVEELTRMEKKAAKLQRWETPKGKEFPFDVINYIWLNAVSAEEERK